MTATAARKASQPVSTTSSGLPDHSPASRYSAYVGRKKEVTNRHWASRNITIDRARYIVSSRCWLLGRLFHEPVGRHQPLQAASPLVGKVVEADERHAGLLEVDARLFAADQPGGTLRQVRHVADQRHVLRLRLAQLAR